MPRRSRRAVPQYRAGSVLLSGSRSGAPTYGGPRHGRRRRRVLPVVSLLVVAAAVVAAYLLWRANANAGVDRRDAAQRFVAGWARGDRAAMWGALTPAARAAHPRARFVAAYAAADRAARVRGVRVGRLAAERGGAIAVPAAVVTRDFGTLRGTIALPVSGQGATAGVDWTPALRLPGLRAGEVVRRRSGTPPARGSILAADGTPLDATAVGASIAGQVSPEKTGLQSAYDARLAGRPAARLLFGRRTIARRRAVPGRSLRTTVRPALASAAAAALGNRLGGVAVLRPRDGAVLALAGLAVSAPQPPGSTFKMITVSAALQSGAATPSTAYPVRTAAILSGVKLANASGEACGGTLTQAFIVSCNSVFAPLGAKIGARRLVATARAFGFDEQPRIPAAKPSTISPPSQLRDDLAVGAAAIGQDRDLSTPLGMASVGATIAAGGIRPTPRITALDHVRRRRAVSTKVAHEVRTMMRGVVRSGTGTAAAIPGVDVAGKTGTAELRPNSNNPQDADAWFVAFAPASRPKAVVAVMLVGAGFGGTAAAPVARQVLQAALSGS